MIAYLSGKLISKTETSVIIDVNGVGYEVFVSALDLQKLGESQSDVQLQIYNHITESSMLLFGFSELSAKTLFKKLISVSGVGPKLGLTILSGISAKDLIQALVFEDTAKLTKISGIGKKTAERMITELKDKFKDMDLSSVSSESSISRVTSQDSRVEETIQALVALGYSEVMAKKACGKLQVDNADTVQTLIRKSLGALSS